MIFATIFGSFGLALMGLLSTYSVTISDSLHFSQSNLNYQPKVIQLDTIAQLPKPLTELSLALKTDNRDNINVPPLFLKTIPKDFEEISSTGKRKEYFLNILVPQIIHVNSELQALRAKAIKVIKQKNSSDAISESQEAFLTNLKTRYKVKDTAQLLERLDGLPTSLVLAQAAIESAWGVSRFAKEGNAYFGQWGRGDGIIPNKRDEGKTHVIRKFPDIISSIRSYMHNINTHGAYKDLRDARKEHRNKYGNLKNLNLTPYLLLYSELKEEYIVLLDKIINQNNLLRFDSAQIIEKSG